MLCSPFRRQVGVATCTSVMPLDSVFSDSRFPRSSRRLPELPIQPLLSNRIQMLDMMHFILFLSALVMQSITISP